MVNVEMVHIIHRAEDVFVCVKHTVYEHLESKEVPR